MAARLRVLILEDCPADAELMLHDLRAAGFDPEWHRVDTEAEFAARLDPGLDVIIADFKLPQFDAMRALEILRSTGYDVPLIVVSGSIGEDVAVEAMKRGAADYVLKDRRGRLAMAVKAAVEARLSRSEMQRAEAALRQSEERYRKMFENTVEGMFQSTPDGRCLQVNPAFARMFGFDSPEQMMASVTGMEQLYANAEDRIRIMEQIERAGHVREVEIEGMRRDGQRIWISMNAIAVKDETGRIAYYEGTTADITQRKRSERVLRLQAAALASAANGIVITDRDGTIEWVNDAFTTMTRYSSREVLGQNPRILKSGEHPVEFYRELWNTILSGFVWRGEVVNRRKDGTQYAEEMTITPVRAGGGSGAITHFVAVKEDITHRKRLEDQLRQAQKMESIGRLAGGVAHDFNNILTVILANTGLLEDQIDAGGDSATLLRQITLAAERAAGLTRQLLTFSRKHPLRMQRLNLNDTIRGLTKMLHRIIGEDVAMDCTYADDLPAIRADIGMIEQVLMNLAVNARDAMPRGGQLRMVTDLVTVDAEHVRREPAARPGQFVRLTVADTGGGIAPEILPFVFEPFFTTKDVGKGTGLGLATAYSVVLQHQGWIELESAVGKGTAFRIYLPAFEQAAEEAKTAAAESAPGGGPEVILVVEDEDMVRRLTCTSLRRLGYEVLEACDAADATRVWEECQERIELLLTDMVMPGGVTGRELAERLQQAKPGLRVLFTSGYSPGASYGIDLEPGVNFLPKPFDRNRLARIVRDCLDREKVDDRRKT
ncbi:MAG: PAS domain S-box protein [Acidobacteriota bacterium]